MREKWDIYMYRCENCRHLKYKFLVGFRGIEALGSN
jgi:hypothetical protein